MINPFSRIKFNKNGLVAEYRKYLQAAERLVEARRYEKALKFLYYSTIVEWLYPVNPKYVDEETEALLDKIADNLLSNISAERKPNQKRVVFYNGQLIDSGALTEQYLNYLIDHDYEFLFVVFGQERCSAGKKILERLQHIPQAHVLIPKSNNYSERIVEIYRNIIDFNPGIALLHFIPNDVIGYCSFTKLKNIHRYYIVHNDHTFWLGKNCSDIFLEFRAFGTRVAIERRGIQEDKIRVLPYYPIVQDVKFQGFPCNVEGKVIGLTGAQLYKYTMDPEMSYFKAIIRLLRENENFIFFLAGAGTVSEVRMIENLIQSEGVQDRFYYIGRRNDFYSLIGQIDILFESYPFTGGLTVLYATNQGKAIVGIARKGTLSGSTEDNLDLVDYNQPKDFDEFHYEATRLIQDTTYRTYIGEKVADNQSTRSRFDKNLTGIIQGTGKLRLRRHYTLELNDEKVLQDYLNLPDLRFTLYNNKFQVAHVNVFTQFLRTILSIKYDGISATSKRLKKKIFH